MFFKAPNPFSEGSCDTEDMIGCW